MAALYVIYFASAFIFGGIYYAVYRMSPASKFLLAS